ncbi:SoxR reducing system RseC family protein [Halopseudomonas salina]|uniref:Positive regulator for alginate biosynthesis MucC n=1 Tax=Halopseudomonas salina TaxID=1323744 RepID=A0ABQ1NUK5_9GAMM|nr:SoxR reducing system RseC family protein [Halopseudomonas salina]GGC85031.1 positive regulator for alginate biosynthesis MucC [Halopseudomonas salina]
MIEERGRILSLEPGAAWVETIRRSTCNSCQARAGCGQALLERLGSGARRGFIRVLCDQPLSIGDEVIIGLPEDAVVKASTLMYILPLLAMFIFAALTDQLGMSEPWIILAAACGLASGFVTTGWWAQRERGNPAYHARVLRHLPDGSAAPLLVRGSF